MPKDIRDSFFDKICEYAFKDEQVIVVTDDMDIFSLREFKSRCPTRFINSGVAEQQIINFASGLASSGKKVIVCGIASFMTYRCFEQIKLNVCGMGLPVTIVGLGAGLSFAFDGPSHFGVQDLAVMRTIPEVEILNPCDSYSAEKCAEVAYSSKSPMYVRLDKGIFPDVYNTRKPYLNYGYCELSEKNRINIISTGIATHIVMDAMNGLNMNVGLYDVFKIKPFDSSIVRDLAASNGIVTVEENSLSGGLHSAVLECMSQLGVSVPVKGIGVMDKPLTYGTREYLQNYYGVSKQKITEEINAFDKAIKK